jgi:hypothetical protein
LGLIATLIASPGGSPTTAAQPVAPNIAVDVPRPVNLVGCLVLVFSVPDIPAVAAARVRVRVSALLPEAALRAWLVQ